MKYRWLAILSVVFAVVAGIVAYTLKTARQGGERPNILLIVLDDFGYNDLGANGNPEAPTPRLDALAAQGTRYTRHYADATCSVARAALMTGTFPAVHGLRPNHLGLSIGTPTIASMLREANYRTQHIGKWHIATATLEQSPSQLGFDRWFGFLHNHETSGPGRGGITYGKPTYINPWLRDNQSPLKQYSGHLTDILTDRAIDFLDQRKGDATPWFLNLWHYAPHSPVQPPDDFRSKFPATDAGAYLALVAHLDASIGRVLDALDRNGQSDNTLVIVLSDNGGANVAMDNNQPFHGKKSELLEGGLRTPLFMRWPGHIKPDTVSDERVSLYDILPTIAQASAAVPPAHLVGRSLLDAQRAPTPQLYWEYSDTETLKYSVLSADGRWRLTRSNSSLQPAVLNDLQADPSGAANVIDRHPEIASGLTHDYLQWRKAARVVDFSAVQLNNRGGAILRGDDLQRSPGYSGFTFAIGVTPEAGAEPQGTVEPQVIVEQAGRWKLQSTAEGLVLDVLGQTLVAPALPPGRCSELVISSHFNFTTVKPKNNWSEVEIFVDGKGVNSVRTERPPLLTWGYANPTYVGFDAGGGSAFRGRLGRPIILNERVLPDDRSGMIGNGISGVPSTCGRPQNEIEASNP